jgi:hypothetical protein
MSQLFVRGEETAKENYWQRRTRKESSRILKLKITALTST